MQWIARDDSGWRTMELRDYIESLPSAYEREICRRYMAGEEIRSIAVSHNVGVNEMKSDLKKALRNYVATGEKEND